MTLATETTEHTEKAQIIPTSGDILQLVSFKLGEEEFGVDILSVQEIIRMLEITTVPHSPHFVEGVINLRGKVLPVVNLRKRLALEPKEYDKNTRIIVVDQDGKNVGFIVDSVSEVLRISSVTTEPPPQMMSRINTEFITAVGKLDDKLVILLDLGRVLSVGQRVEVE